MKFAMLGGDARGLILCRLLRADGHAVTPFALEGAMPDCAASAAEAADGADCLLLPLPCEKRGALNAPFSEWRGPASALVETAKPGTPVLAGAPGETLREACRRLDLPLTDYAAGEDFALQNADLTAEGALQLLLERLPRALKGSRVLIVGYGRIGQALAEKLLSLGAGVTVAARREEARTRAEEQGCRALKLREAAQSGFDAVVNTVPAVLFREEELGRFGGALLLELASPPYGFDPEAAQGLGREILLASGLPAKTAPESAAEAIRQSVYRALRLQVIPLTPPDTGRGAS